MKFDFYEQYKHYSNAELLQIAQQPDAYQPEAVEAASGILKERGVKDKPLAVKEPFNEPTTHLLDSFDLTEERKPSNLLVFFLITVAMEYLWMVYNTVKAYTPDMALGNEYFIVLKLLDLAFIPFIFYLLLKRKTWGWILIVLSTVLTTITRLTRLDLIFEYVGLDNVQGLTIIAITFLKLAFAWYLWRKEVLTYFDVKRDAKFWTAVAAICILMAVFLIKLFTLSAQSRLHL